jgi:hypothetical protein
VTAGGVADQVRQDDIIAVVVIPGAARRGLEIGAFRESRHIALDIFHPVDGRQRAGERGIERTAHRQSTGMAQQMVDRDDMAGIAGVLPRRDRGRFIDVEFALANKNACQCRGHRFGRGIAKDRRVDAIARRIALRNDVAVLNDDDRRGVAERRLLRLREGAIERALEVRIGGLDRRRSGDLGQQCALRLASRWRQRDIGLALDDVTPQTLAIDGTALSAAKQRCCHLLGFAIDVVAERPGDQPDTGHRLHGFGIDLIGINSRHEGRRTQSMRDEAGCDTRYVVRPHGRQR